ncbi:MAG: protein kinase [Acidobacteria bacterium]|nr:protein kinase [Acidobacteriota bacterium]
MSSPVAEPTRLGRYRITGKIGQGGMGAVYAAFDESLGRSVAIKLCEHKLDQHTRQRLWREARSLAAVNHPNICQIYEVAEEHGRVFLAMELLEGEPLDRVLERGPMPVAEAVQTMLGVLSALDTLHKRGIVHRDLKPGNMFATAHGIKLLDFGLARSLAAPTVETQTATVLSVAVEGTPQYMAPEQFEGDADARSDLFAAGAILFEMLSGRRAFTGRTLADLVHAIKYDNLPALGGSSVIAAVDHVVRRAVAKRPADRYASAEAMAQDLRLALLASDTAVPARARAVRRLIVLPFRVLRPDPEIDFLCFSLPDAITHALSGLQSLLVRSSLVASRYASAAPDVKAIAAEAEVDMVLTGTLLRGGEELRVLAQLVQAPSGTLVWSHPLQVPVGDVFRLQDEIVRLVIESIAPSLTSGEQRLLQHDVPADARAYELYLRGNEIGRQLDQLAAARDLYLKCVELDPEYAPAWAQLGRCYRVLGKVAYDTEANTARAEAAFQKALSLNPDLPLAHHLYSHLEAERGRALDAMVRLLGRAQTNRSDPELFAGLVLVCRYCGLLDASIAAHEQAVRLDPNVRTSVVQAYFLKGDYQAVLTAGADIHGLMAPVALAMLGREQEAADALRANTRVPAFTREFMEPLQLIFEGRKDESLRCLRGLLDRVTTSRGLLYDPEGIYHVARQLAWCGERAEALEYLGVTVEQGFYCFPAFLRDPWLDSLRSDLAFNAILRRAEERYREAVAAFYRASGDRVLQLVCA